MPTTTQGIVFGDQPILVGAVARVREVRRGLELRPRDVLEPGKPGRVNLGMGDTEVVVAGRLIASDAAGLHAAMDAVIGLVQQPPQPGTLVDGQGRAWQGMHVVGVAWSGAADRGRVWSVGFELMFTTLGA